MDCGLRYELLRTPTSINVCTAEKSYNAPPYGHHPYMRPPPPAIFDNHVQEPVPALVLNLRRGLLATNGRLRDRKLQLIRSRKTSDESNVLGMMFVLSTNHNAKRLSSSLARNSEGWWFAQGLWLSCTLTSHCLGAKLSATPRRPP